MSGRRFYNREAIGRNVLDVVETHLGARIEEVELLRSDGVHQLWMVGTGQVRYVVKCYGDRSMFRTAIRSAEAEYRGLLQCNAASIASPRPVLRLENGLVMTHVPGDSLSSVGLTRLPIVKIVDWLTTLHRSTPHVWSPPESHEFLPTAERMLRSQAEHKLDSALANALNRLERLRSLVSTRMAPIRGDSALRNWMVDGECVYGIDLEFFSLGQPALDVGWLAASLMARGFFSRVSFTLACDSIKYYEASCGRLPEADLHLGVLLGLIFIAFGDTRPGQRELILNGGIRIIDDFIATCRAGFSGHTP